MGSKSKVDTCTNSPSIDTISTAFHKMSYGPALEDKDTANVSFICYLYLYILNLIFKTYFFKCFYLISSSK